LEILGTRPLRTQKHRPIITLGTAFLHGRKSHWRLPMLLPLAVNSNLTHYQEVCEKAAVLHWEKAGLGERNHHGRPC